MTDPAWDSLLIRLERDLQARNRGDLTSTDDAAWVEVSGLIRRYSEVFSRRGQLDSDAADEIAQETLIKLQNVDTIRRLRAAGSPTGYILVMVRNLVIDTVRRRRRTMPVEIPLSEELISEYEPAVGQGDAERTARLRAALASLRPEERELLRLRFWRDLSISEIAERTGLNYSAAAVRLFRILKSLREKLGPNM
jgi:RNA polymerase sigma factor (sigma-70 family)